MTEAKDKTELIEENQTLRETVLALERDVAHWKANHANRCDAARLLIERVDMPLERIGAYRAYLAALSAAHDLRERLGETRAPGVGVIADQPLGRAQLETFMRDMWDKYFREASSSWAPAATASGMVPQLSHMFANMDADRKDADAATQRAYLERNRVVSLLARVFPAGIARTVIEDWDPEWYNCVYIDTPTGQMSWHYHDRDASLFAGLPPYFSEWDGHTTSEKYGRVAELVSRLDAARSHVNGPRRY